MSPSHPDTHIQTFPDYPGADSNQLGLQFSFDVLFFRSRWLSFGDTTLPADPLRYPNGFVPRLSCRYQAPRDSDDHSELRGLDDIDFAIESGFGLGWVNDNLELFADVRYGAFGHESFVSELTAFYVARPSNDQTIRLGVRALYGADEYLDTYFGVSATEAANSQFDGFDPADGFVSLGVEAIYTHRIRGGFWFEGGIVYERLQNDAARSPIASNGSRDQYELWIGIRRAFSLRL